MEEIMGVTYTHWDCPCCGTVNEAEGDVSGEVVKCWDCEEESRIREVA